ncbi:MAG: hypothetical protein HQK72_12520 [Desulfamplus sp.]|nr:hypothetical protein [Desulfamplus sp.]
MVSESKQNKDRATLLLYNYNRRKLKIVLEKNHLSKELYNQIKNIFDEQLNNGTQLPFEEVCSYFESLSLKDIEPIINKEIFKYNQIIIKLAQQFAKNTITQQLKLQKHDAISIKQANDKLQGVFSKILKDLTNDYLASCQRNIDDILVESGFIQESQLEFLHSSAEHLEIKVQDRKFGEIAVNNEFTTQEIVNKALDEQTERYKQTNKNHIIGDILVEQQHITTEIRNEILIIQNRVLEEDWEETLKEVGQSSIEEKEKNAMFGALILKERLLDEKQVVEALKIQAKELENYRKSINGQSKMIEVSNQKLKPRWIGDILVEDFGLSERDRKRIVKKQMEYKIERINLKLGLNLSDAHIELFNEMDQYFELSYSKDNIEAYIKVIKPVPKSMTKDNIIIWLYHKKIRYGRINSAIDILIANKVKPGKSILLAKGDEPIPAQMKYKFHFNTDSSKRTSRGILSSIVKKGSKLITLQKIKGNSGLNVNHCFIAPSMITPLTIIKGENVIRNDNSFVASCDGVPNFSENRVISLASLIYIDYDVTPENIIAANQSAMESLQKSISSKHTTQLSYDCDFHIKGTIEDGVVFSCRQLKVGNIKGKVNATDDVTVQGDTINGEIISKGNIHLKSIQNSVVSSEKNIAIQLHSDDANTSFIKIYHSIITSDDIFRISDAKIVASVIRAKNKIILRKVTVGEKCKFIIGDSIETITYKKRIEELNSDIELIDIQIKDVQEQSRELFEKIEKKDIAAIDQEIKNLSKNQKTKGDVDKIAELRVIKRQKEKEYEASVDKYGTIFMQNSQQIKQYQDKKHSLEKEKKELNSSVMAIYKKEQEIPELDIRRSMLPAGTVIQFRYHKQVLKADCEGFVFREEFNHSTNQYELKQHRW